MTYEQAKNAIFVSGTVSDGYFGERASVGFTFDPSSGLTLCVADCGYFDSGLPPALTQAESMWLLTHHPIARNIKVT